MTPLTTPRCEFQYISPLTTAPASHLNSALVSPRENSNHDDPQTQPDTHLITNDDQAEIARFDATSDAIRNDERGTARPLGTLLNPSDSVNIALFA